MKKVQKMSKSKGNIIDPLDLLNKYGADTLRFALTALINPGRDVKISESRIQGYKSFTNKIWNAANFLIINNCKYNPGFNYNNIESTLNQWIINNLFELKNNIDQHIKNYAFHELAHELYHFIWHQYCDWYVELSKSSFQNNSKYAEETKNVAIWSFVEILKITHSVMPFITEELWNKLTNSDDFLMNQTISIEKVVSKYSKSKNNLDHLIEIIVSIRNIRAELNISYKTLINIEISNDNLEIIDFIRGYNNELIRLLKIKNVSYNSAISSNIESSYLIVKNTTITIPLKGIIDTKSELRKIENKKNKHLNELQILETKLSNSIFLKKAPKEVIDQFKQDVIEIKSTIEKLDQIINNIH